mgnify:CR=1 FL=1
MLPYIAEFLGTMILIILGDGVVANVTLNKSGMKGGWFHPDYLCMGALRLCCPRSSSALHPARILIRR